MEVGVRLVGIFLRLLNLLLAPLYWLRSRDQRKVPPISNPILLKSAKELAAAIRRGDITSTELVYIYIDRINEVNPLINAVVEERFSAALQEAKDIDRSIEEAKRNGTFEEYVKDKPLLGVPFTVKESCSLGGLSNSVGLREHWGRVAARDGAAAARLRAAGGVPLLASSTPELCLGWETCSLLRGATCNPYCRARTPGGSSGGEAALAASGATAFGLASDIAGSVRLPAAFCGVFGHKPSPGIVPIDGHVPFITDPKFPKFLTMGPITRWADDLPLLLEIMAGENKHKLNLDQPVDMKDIKVFYMTEATTSIALIDVDKCIKDSIKNAVKYLEQCGATVSEEKFKGMEDSVEISITEFFSMKDIPNMLQDPANPKKDKNLLVELIKSLFGCASRSQQALSFAFIEKTRLFIPESKTELYHALADRLQDHMQRTLGADGVFLYPVCSGAAHEHSRVVPRASGVVYTMLFNVLGLPATAVPVGLHHALPVSIQVVAAPNQDRLCLAVAKQLEIGFGGWRPPA